jgi:hypothetical protein
MIVKDKAAMENSKKWKQPPINYNHERALQRRVGQGSIARSAYWRKIDGQTDC